MLVKVNSINKQEHKATVTLLDVDDLGSVIPIKNLRLRILPNDESLLQSLKSSSHAIIFTEGFNDEDDSTIISVMNLTDDELNYEKENMIKAANDFNPSGPE